MTPTPAQLDRMLDLLVEAVVRELQPPEQTSGPRAEVGAASEILSDADATP